MQNYGHLERFVNYFKNHQVHGRKWFNPTQILVVGFAMTILVGALILMTPLSSASGQWTDFVSALFTATSAVCVTGLIVVDTGTYWSGFGQFVIIALIQIGGLGFMTFTTLAFFIARKRIGLKERMVLQEGFNAYNLGGIVKYTKYVLFYTFIVELIGAVFLTIGFAPDYGLGRGIVMGVFHSISSFCNAGFDLIGNYRSITGYVDNYIITITIGTLIVIGGLGFFVASDIFKKRSFKKLAIHTKLVLIVNTSLLLMGMILFFIFEYNNPETMKNLPLDVKILASWFQSVTPRTAGYNSLDLASMTTASSFLTIILMFIGASPGSTGGGIKTTTFAAILLTVVSVLKGKDETEVFRKTIPMNIIKRALSVVCIALLVVTISVAILSFTEDASFLEICYEVASGFATVGLTMGITQELTTVGRLVIILTMFIGRLGPLTIALAIAQLQSSSSKGKYKYPDGDILVG